MVRDRNGNDGDKIVLVGSYDLLYKFTEFIERDIPGAVVRIKQCGNYYCLFIYSKTARTIAKILYEDCTIVLD
jgi:hypothetical protein